MKPFPETLIGNSVEAYLNLPPEQWCAIEDSITSEAYAEYLRCFRNSQTICATCLDYRGIEFDLKHDDENRGCKLTCPVVGR